MAVETHPEDFVAESAVEKKPIPAYLIKETIDGVNYYYKGFREVLNKTKTKADIMADSGLQLFIKSWLMSLLFKNLDENRYYILGGEAGAHIDHRNNLSLDLTVFDNTVLTPDKITTKYIDVPPKIVIEIDVNVEV
ncbi:MAG: Uma2 family endonuclease, partial [Bacteroidota bacterium]